MDIGRDLKCRGYKIVLAGVVYQIVKQMYQIFRTERSISLILLLPTNSLKIWEDLRMSEFRIGKRLFIYSFNKLTIKESDSGEKR